MGVQWIVGLQTQKKLHNKNSLLEVKEKGRINILFAAKNVVKILVVVSLYLMNSGL